MTRLIDCSGKAVCPVCGRAFPCGASTQKNVCWCFYFPVVDDSSLKEKGIHTCVCPVCLRNMAVRQGIPENQLPKVTFTETEWELK
ncbi:MAG: cysteine-rich CWC family protein [Syntrophales bacterium]|jgi:hypothetical protein